MPSCAGVLVGEKERRASDNNGLGNYVVYFLAGFGTIRIGFTMMERVVQWEWNIMSARKEMHHGRNVDDR